MTKRGFITVYSIVAFAVLAAAVLWFSVSVSSEARRGTEEAERTFSWLSRETSRNSYSLGFLTDAYIDEMIAICRRTSTLEAMTISTPTGTIYAWPEQSEDFVYSTSGEPIIQKTSFFTRVFHANIDMGANASPAVQITAAINILPPSVIFSASRNSFILIFLVLISTITVILVTGKPKIARETEFEDGETARDSDFPEDSDEAFDFNFEDDALPDMDSDGDFPSESGTGDAPLEFSDESSGPDSEAGAFPSEAEFKEEPETFASTDYAATEEDEEKPEGLFSKASGLGWQEYLEERLGAELTRAASFEQDAGLLILRVFNLDRTDMAFRRTADILVETFKYRDMLFEYGANAFACIIPSATLDEIMQMAEKLYADVQTMLTEMQRKCKICIGITTRAARILPASRMIEEADTATRKAEEEQRLPIVAFRANPDKYRDYVVRNINKAEGLS